MRCREKSKGPLKAGFSLVEVLVSVVVAAMVFLAFFGVQALGIRTRAHARLASAALDRAGDFLDQVSLSAEDSVVIDGEGIADSGFVENEPGSAGMVFSKRWEIQRGVPAPDLLTVRVLVCWNEPRKPPPTAAHCDFPDPAAPHVALEGVLYRP